MTEKEVRKILEEERGRKVEILKLLEEIEYERNKGNVKAVVYDQERVSGGGGNSDPFFGITEKIIFGNLWQENSEQVFL